MLAGIESPLKGKSKWIKYIVDKYCYKSNLMHFVNRVSKMRKKGGPRRIFLNESNRCGPRNMKNKTYELMHAIVKKTTAISSIEDCCCLYTTVSIRPFVFFGA